MPPPELLLQSEGGPVGLPMVFPATIVLLRLMVVPAPDAWSIAPLPELSLSVLATLRLPAVQRGRPVSLGNMGLSIPFR